MLRSQKGSFKTKTGHEKQQKFITEKSNITTNDTDSSFFDNFSFDKIKKSISSMYDSVIESDSVKSFRSFIGQEPKDTKTDDDNDKKDSTKNDDSQNKTTKDDSSKDADVVKQEAISAKPEKQEEQEAQKVEEQVQTEQEQTKKELEVNKVSDFQHAAYFAASFLFILAISSFSSARTARRGVLLGLGGMALAIWASFFSPSWDLGDSFRWLVSFLIGAALGLFAGLNAKMSQMGQTVCLLQAMVGAASFLLGLAQYEHFEYLDIEFSGLVSSQTVCVCLLGSTLFSSTLTSFYKLDKKNLAKKPLETIGKKRDIINTIVIVSLIVLGILYIWFNYGWCLWVIIFLSLYIGWGLTVSAHPREMNVIVPCQTFLTGLTIAFVGFMLDRHYLLLVGALCITGGYSLTAQSAKSLNCSIQQVFFKSWSKSSNDSVASENQQFGYQNQLISESDLAHELLYSDKIVFVPGNGIYTSLSTQAISEIAYVLKHLNKQVTFCIHPCAGRIPGHIQAVLASYEVPYSSMKQMDQVDFSEYDLAIVIGAYDEVDPDNISNQHSSNYGMPTCKVWESNKVIYIETQVEKYRGNGLFDKQNVSILKGETNKLLAHVVKDFQRKGFADMDPEERNLVLKNGSLPISIAGSNHVSADTPNPQDLDELVKNSTRILGVFNETSENKENRVAVTPSIIRSLLKNGIHTWVEKDSGKQSGFNDEEYYKAGAKIATANEIFQNASIQIFISEFKDKQISQIGKNVELLIAPLGKDRKQLAQKLAKNEKLTVIDLSDISPQLARAQKFSTQANQETLSCYRSVFEGFYHLNKISRPVFNSTGKSAAANVLVVGAGHIGLTVASIAKQYGASVRVYDKRDGLKHTIKRSGFTPVEFVYQIIDNNPNHVEEVQKQALKDALKTTDLVITAAFNEDGKGEKILSEEMCSQIRRGGVIVDLAGEKGGNTSLTQVDQSIYDANTGIHVIAYTSNTYCTKLNRQSSELHSLNINHLFNQIFLNKNLSVGLVDFTDETLREVIYVHKGNDVSARPIKKVHAAEKIANEEEIPSSSEAKQLLAEKSESDRENINIKSESSIHGDDLGNKIEDKQENQTFGDKIKSTFRKTGQLLESSKDYAVNLIADQFSEKQEERINKNPGVFATLLTLLILVFCILLGVHTDSEFIFQLGLFILALFVGDTVIRQVDPGLNAPLLLFLQTLSGSIGVACMLVFSQGDNVEFWSVFTIIATIGNIFAMICIVAGFTLTYRSIDHFTPAEYKIIDPSE